MKNLFQKWKAKLEVKVAQEAEEQRKRIEQLHELESTQAQKGFLILHPVQAAKNSKEIKRLREEIESYKRQQESKKSIPLLIGMLAIIFVSVGVIALFEDKESSTSSSMNSINTVSQPISSNDSSSFNADGFISSDSTTSENISSTDTSSSNEPSSSSAISSENVSSTTSSQYSSSTPSESSPLTIEDISATAYLEYSHIRDLEHIRLGNNEGCSLHVTVEKPGITIKDIYLGFDRNLLSVMLQETTQQETYTEFEYRITGKTACETTLKICTSDDYKTMGNDAPALFFDIVKLDSYEGTIVYVSATGTKYHISTSCAGDSAMKTTRRDATGLDYSPCNVCAK